jgi:arylsulfatase A-like enzyme
LYDGEVRAIDQLVGDILSAIEQQVGFERSLVVFTSDHGEALCEHGMFEHGHSLHREVTHIPLIVMSPGLPEGRTVSQYVRTIDILPTILDIVHENDSLLTVAQGKSLLPLITGELSNLPVFSEAMLYGGTERSLISGIHKLMYDQQEDRYALYDVAEDPGETLDLLSHEAPRGDKLVAALTDFYEALAADRLARIGGTPRPREVDERMLKALRALGYVSD